MAFLEPADLVPKAQPAAPVVVAHPAPRSKLVPALLITLNVGVLALVAVAVLPGISLPSISFGGGASAPADVASLDPKLLTTREGRRLTPVTFGNMVFEVTRVAYYPDVRSRTVTITVPGDPPQQAMFRVGESFASGRIRVVEIQPSGVVLESAGVQETFLLDGAVAAPFQPASGSQPTGYTMVPARSDVIVPDLPAGQVRPAVDPRLTNPAVPAAETEKPESWDSLEDLPVIIQIDRAELSELVKRLPAIFLHDVVTAAVLEPETREPWGVQIKAIRADNVLGREALLVGDIILGLNGEEIRRVRDLEVAVSQLQNAEELVFDLQRGGELLQLIIEPGVVAQPADTPGLPTRK